MYLDCAAEFVGTVLEQSESYGRFGKLTKIFKKEAYSMHDTGLSGFHA